MNLQVQTVQIMRIDCVGSKDVNSFMTSDFNSEVIITIRVLKWCLVYGKHLINIYKMNYS